MALQDTQTLKNNLDTGKEFTVEEFADFIDLSVPKSTKVNQSQILGLHQDFDSEVDKSGIDMQIKNIAINTHDKRSFTKFMFSNAPKSFDEMSEQMYQLDYIGNKVTNNDDIGKVGNVTVINVGDVNKKKVYIKFTFKINENINIERPDFNYTGNNPDMLNIFSLILGYTQRIGIIPRPFTNHKYDGQDYSILKGQTQVAS